jgi:hypothetical protein
MHAPYYNSLVWQIPVGAAQLLGSWGHPLVEIFHLFSRGLESNLESHGEAVSAGRGHYGQMFGRIYLVLGPPYYKQRTEAILHLLVRLECKNVNMIEVPCLVDK